MKRFKKYILIISFTFLFISLPEQIFACVAIYSNVPFCFKYKNAEAVYLGELITEPQYSEDEGYEKLTFKIKETYKGKPHQQLEIFNQSKIITSCDLLTKVQKSETWVIFLSSNDDGFFLKKNSFKYDNKNYQEEINFFRKAALGEIETSIHGQILTTCVGGQSKLNITNLNITLENQDLKLTAQTDKSGNFSFRNINAGTYKIRVAFPFNTLIQETFQIFKTVFDNRSKTYVYEYETTVTENECEFNPIFIKRQEKGGNKCI